MSESVLFLPQSASPDRDTLIITTNHLGADMEGDAGLDAQYLADTSGHAVLGLNRLGSGNDAHYSSSLAERITTNPEDVTLEWFEALKPEIAKQAPSRVELVGRSAGANLMLHVAALELIPETVGVMAVEGLRFESIPTRKGQLIYAQYQLRHEGRYRELRDDIVDADLKPSAETRPASAANPLKMLKRQLIDIRHYQHLWASDMPYVNAMQVADWVDISAAIYLAEDSMAAEQPNAKILLEQLKKARMKSPLHNNLVATTIEDTTHGSFDDQRLYATLYRRFKRLVDLDHA